MRSIKIVTASFKQTPTIFSTIFKKLWFVLLIPVAASYFLTVAKMDGLNNGTGGQISLNLSIFLNFFFFLMLIPVSICWTEKVIKKEDLKLNFDTRIFASLGYTILVYLIVYLPIGGLFFVFIALGKEAGMNQYVAGTAFLISTILWWANSMRFVLIQPAIAVRNPATRLARSWHLTKGSVIKIIIATMVPLLSLSILVSFASAMVEIFHFDQISVIASSVLISSLHLYFTMILCEVYGRIFINFLAPQKLDDYL